MDDDELRAMVRGVARDPLREIGFDLACHEPGTTVHVVKVSDGVIRIEWSLPWEDPEIEARLFERAMFAVPLGIAWKLVRVPADD